MIFGSSKKIENQKAQEERLYSFFQNFLGKLGKKGAKERDKDPVLQLGGREETSPTLNKDKKICA